MTRCRRIGTSAALKLEGHFVLVLVLERGYSYGLALQLCGSALSELHPRSGLEVLEGRCLQRLGSRKRLPSKDSKDFHADDDQIKILARLR
jgi:hypothetical protein